MSLIARRFFCFLLLAVASTAALRSAPVERPPVNPSGFVIHRGTNLSHWLSQDFGWAPREVWITENDFDAIARFGFDHVRLPIDEHELWHEDGTPNEPAFALLLQAIEWSRAYDLRVIVDLHTVRAHHFNAANEGLTNTLWSDPAAQETFIALWRELSKRLRHFPVDTVAYEIMNEPVADDHQDWNRLVARTLQFIRSVEPDRVVVIGSNRWQLPSTLPFLEVPADDKNIILSTHTYAPLAFTHYRANWTPLKGYTGPVKYPGPVVDAAEFKRQLPADDPFIREMAANAAEDWGVERLRQEFEPAIRRARELGLQLYCGEFGCLPTVPREDRLAYYRDIIAVMEENGLAWANWEYKGDFGIYEWHGTDSLTGAPDFPLLEALFQRR
jgi:endoglucanase